MEPMSQLMDTSIARQFERLPPHSIEAEMCLLASLAHILNAVPSAAHGAHYASIVREKGMLRQLISASNEILRDAYAPHEQADLVLDKAEKKIFEIAQKKVGNAMVPMEDVLHEVFEMIENRGQRG